MYLFGVNEVFDQEVNKCATCLSPTLKILINLGGFPESGSTFFKATQASCPTSPRQLNLEEEAYPSSTHICVKKYQPPNLLVSE